MVKPNTVDTGSSPWRIEERSGRSVCHYCGHAYDMGWEVRKQHNQGCPWLVAHLKEAAEDAIADGPRVLNEDSQR
jgi:hypothetical protein